MQRKKQEISHIIGGDKYIISTLRKKLLLNFYIKKGTWKDYKLSYRKSISINGFATLVRDLFLKHPQFRKTLSARMGLYLQGTQKQGSINLFKPEIKDHNNKSGAIVLITD